MGVKTKVYIRFKQIFSLRLYEIGRYCENDSFTIPLK